MVKCYPEEATTFKSEESHSLELLMQKRPQVRTWLWSKLKEVHVSECNTVERCSLQMLSWIFLLKELEI